MPVAASVRVERWPTAGTFAIARGAKTQAQVVVAGGELIFDANEGWRADTLGENLAACAEAGVTLVEQPLPADADECLAGSTHAIPICADESVHDRASLPRLAGKYDAINIKLDK